MRIVNLTPHVITVVARDGQKINFAASGQVARVAVQSHRLDEGTCFQVEGIGKISFDLSTERLGDPTGLPDPEQGVFYIVSRLVFDHPANIHRQDLLCPDTGRAVRENGQIVGVPGFLVHQPKQD